MPLNELIQKEMVECSQTSKSKEQKHKNKDYLKHSIHSLLQYLITKLHLVYINGVFGML